MKNIDKVIDAFITGDYFILFLVLTLIIILILILALIKSRGDYNELLEAKENNDKTNNEEANTKFTKEDEEDILSELSSLMADSKEDVIDVLKRDYQIWSSNAL